LFLSSAALAYAVSPSSSYVRGEPQATSTVAALFKREPETSAVPLPVTAHAPVPEHVRGIYMTQCAVGTPSLRDSLVSFIEASPELNAVVIDIRDYTGYISFDTDNPMLTEYVSTQCGARDMKAFIEELHTKNIYVIGRITTFQNPAYTKNHPDQAVQRTGGGVWKDHKGLSFVDVGAKPYWENVVALARESYNIGFDELNFDYIRFPSDGNMAAADYSWSRGKSKPEALEEFYQYLTKELRPEGSTPGENTPMLSVDLFGMVTTNTDDLNIGQVLERALPYFDYIYPMVYPSHYPSGFHGYKNVNANSYGIVHFSMSEAVRRTVATTTTIASFAYTPLPKASTSSPQLYEKPSYPASKMRPWLQSFDYPVTYTAAMVAEQIKANEDAGLHSYLFWDPANKYRSLRQVLGQ
jgi:hypothetical protein